MTDVELTPQADDHLEPLDPEARERILKKLGEAQEWTEHRLKPLSNYPYYTLRAGDYRAIITWDREADVLIVEAVGQGFVDVVRVSVVVRGILTEIEREVKRAVDGAMVRATGARRRVW